jgi:homoprotocatechuate degradation regulator HpaR
MKAADDHQPPESNEPQAATSNFERSLPRQVARLRALIVKRFRGLVETMEEHGLTEQQWRTINALSEVEEIDVMEIGRRCVILPGSMSRIIAKLVDDGLVNRRTDEKDQRRSFVSLSPRGRAFYLRMRKHSAAVHRRILADLGAERLTRFQQMLAEVIERLDVEDEE